MEKNGHLCEGVTPNLPPAKDLESSSAKGLDKQAADLATDLLKRDKPASK